MGCFNKGHSKEQYLTVCICLSLCHPVIPEERRGDSSGCRHCGKPNKALHSRRKPGMNHQVSRWDPAAFLMCCTDQRGGHFQPCKFLVAKFSLDVLVSMFGHAPLWAPGTWQWECSQPWAEGAVDALLPLAAMLLSCTAEPLFLRRQGGDLIPSCDSRQPLLSC